MRVCAAVILAIQAVSAITGPRANNQLDRRRQISIPQQGPVFSDNPHRFGQNLLPNTNVFLQQPDVPSTQPELPRYQQSQPVFQQSQYSPQPQHAQPSQTPQWQLNHNTGFNNNNFEQNSFLQHSEVPFVAQSQFPSQQTLIQPQPTQSVLQQPLRNLQSSLTQPTIIPQQQQQPLQNNGHALNIPHQSPTQNIFLPTLPTQPTQLNAGFDQLHNTQGLESLNLNPLHQAANNFNQFNQQNQHQIAFQPSLGSNPLFTDGQSSHIQNLFEQQKNEDIDRYKEYEQRQRIIEKHKQFLERQQQKQQEKVNQLHEEFLEKEKKKFEQVFSTTEYEELLKRTQSKPRTIYPQEVDLFRKAVKMFEDLHSTTTTSTTPTPTTTTVRTTTAIKPRDPKYKVKQRPKSRPSHSQYNDRQKLYSEIKNILEEGGGKPNHAKNLLEKPELLKQLRLAIAENPEDLGEKNFSAREIALPNGQKIELIKTTNPNLIPNGAITADGSSFSQLATASSNVDQKTSFEELTQGVLPPGADFELIKQSESGKLEEVEKIPTDIQNKKKVTFVFLEEQNDGSYKVKGVKANGQQKEEDAPEVDNILKKIKNGEIQLPTPIKSSTSHATTPFPSTLADNTQYTSAFSSPSSYSPTTANYDEVGYTGSRTTNYYQTTLSPITNGLPIDYRFTDSIQGSSLPTKYTSAPTSGPTRISLDSNVARTNPVPKTAIGSRSVNSGQPSTRNIHYGATSSVISPTSTTFRQPEPTYTTRSVTATSPRPPQDIASSQDNFATQSSAGLVETLKENGLFATAKYLKQSGLDSILNETGPYTIFAPTDKAFRTLLVQLGGPDKAEEKFKDNPRLLSGLLLHHVIPGAFEIASLQDEMTGVSLAGTQLRVNQYDMHDVEWNEIKVTTINGARVVEDRRDIRVPQGVAHAVDRVMFPLPVGDALQTLAADRDRRFTHFLRLLQGSGFAETLSGTKTYTVFAPTDAAFARLGPGELARLEADAASARALVSRHVAPATLYSAGMRYYQLRDSMDDAKPITLQKNSGRIKVNNAQVVTHNIPTTNGVIHAIDTLL